MATRIVFITRASDKPVLLDYRECQDCEFDRKLPVDGPVVRVAEWQVDMEQVRNLAGRGLITYAVV